MHVYKDLVTGYDYQHRGSSNIYSLEGMTNAV